VPNVLKSGSLNLLEPSGPAQACNGIALSFYGGKCVEFLWNRIFVLPLYGIVFFLFFSRNLIYFPLFLFILPEAIISIIEHRDEFYDKRTFLMDRRRVLCWHPKPRTLLSVLVKPPAILLYLN
jgi:hypothetical protein